MTADHPQIAAVIVCHNAADDLTRCLAALDAGSLQPAVTCIVDSGSDDTAYLEALAERPRTRCIRTGNIGYGPGNNRGLAEIPLDIPLVLFLNPDCFVLPDTLEQAAALFAADPDLAAVGPRLVGFDRERDAPTGLLDSTGIVRAWYGRWRDRGQGEPDDGRYDAPEAMPALCGACLFCRRDALEAVAPAPGQAFDPAFFLYKEDIELCLRLRKHGFRLLYHPALRARHCRGWQGRAAMPRKLRLVAAANEIRLYRRHPSPYMLWALAKYILVRWFERGTFVALIQANEAIPAADLPKMLIEAVRQNHLFQMAFLLQAGADVNAQPAFFDRTALMVAVENGHADCARLLMQAGADLEAKGGDFGDTALMTAVENGQMDCIELLIQSGADVNAKNRWDKTALIMATENGDANCVRLLIQSGADVDAKGDYWDDRATTQKHDRATALMIAAEKGLVDCARLLITAGADANAKSGNGNTALMWAVRETARVVPLLIEAGADVNAKSGEGTTALMAAVIKDRVDCARLLIEAGADVNATTNNGWSALMEAGYWGAVGCIRLFIEAGADVNAKSGKGTTALMAAASTCWARVDAVQLLLEAGADMNARNNDGKTALGMVRTGRCREVAELLDAAGATR